MNAGLETFTYDASNNRLSDLWELWSNVQWVNYDRYTYTYDAQGNLTSLWHDHWGFSSWAPEDLYWNTVDRAGNNYSYFGYNFMVTRKLWVVGDVSEGGGLPAGFLLSQNYPNPFNLSTTIKFELPRASQVNLSVFDLLGREVSVLVNERSEAGVHEVTFDGSNLASGVYFYRLQAGTYVETRKLLLLK